MRTVLPHAPVQKDMQGANAFANGRDTTQHHVVSARIASGSYVQARGVQGTCAKNCARWNSMRRATTLCMPVMGVARADGLYGHG